VGPTPPFDESLTSFLRFVSGEGFSTELVWVFREDVSHCIRDYWVRVPVPAANTTLARDYFEFGRGQGRGVTLEVLCRLGGRSACFVWVPEDDGAASNAMQGPLKLKVPANPVEASAVRSGLAWRWLRWYHRRRRCVRFAELLPRRAEAERRTKPCT
jgi:hypothetical protein